MYVECMMVYIFHLFLTIIGLIYFQIDEKRYKPYRHKKFPWFRVIEELCANNIATYDEQITTDPTILITRNLDLDSSKMGESLHESRQVIDIDDTVNQTPRTDSLISPISIPSAGTESGRTNSVAEKHKRGDASRVFTK